MSTDRSDPAVDTRPSVAVSYEAYEARPYEASIEAGLVSSLGDSGPCLSEEEVLAFSEGSLMPAEIESVHAHLDWCPTCQELVNAAVHQWNHPPATAADRIWMATFGPGQIIASRYRIERFLGRGGMGEVYSAFDRVLGEWVALKTLLSTTSDNPHAVRRLFSEARLARRISHPNVCRVHDVGVHEEPGRIDERLPFLTMEFIDGRRLKQILRSGPLELDLALSMARQILAGLGAAHAAGVLHRDLKSDNVMVSGQGRDARIAITDFGLSQALDRQARAVGTCGQERVGSLAYMAPEQLLGHELGPETDLFCFGVVLFEMLCGKLPFLPERDGGPISRRPGELPELPSQVQPGLPRGLDAVVQCCLREKPSDRFARASDVALAIEAAALPS